MPKMHISRSIKIDAPADKVFKVISDFSDWRPWSPWLITEPEAKVTIAEDGQSYSWVGKRTGEGKMAIRSSEENKSLDLDLNFIKPWKSYADTRFYLKEEGGSTEVTWVMDSSMPFFLFFLVKLTTAMIGMDYDRGLAMLKEYVETGDVSSKLEFVGSSEFAGGKYVGIKTDTTIENIGPSMEGDFEKLMSYMNNHQDKMAGPPVSIYHKWDVVKGQVSYTSGFPVSEAPDDLPSGMFIGEMKPTKVNTVRHIGKYDYMGNAWSTLYSMKQAKEFKQAKIHPFEVYINDPKTTPEKEWITDVCFAIK